MKIAFILMAFNRPAHLRRSRLSEATLLCFLIKYGDGDMEFAATVRMNGHDSHVSISDDGWSRIGCLVAQAFWLANNGRWPNLKDFEYHTEDGKALNPGTLLRRSGLKSECKIIVNKPIGNGA